MDRDAAITLTVTLVLTSVFLSLSLVQGDLDPTICMETEPVGTKVIPPLPQSYEADFELTKRNLKAIQFVTEIYDDSKRRGAVTTYYNGAQNKIIHDNGPGQIVTNIEGMNYDNFFEHSQCKVSKFVANYDNLFLSHSEVKTKKQHTIRNNGLFQYDWGAVFKYLGPTTVRNLKADSWSVCYSSPVTDATLQIRVYWSDDSSIAPSGDPLVPLRIEISGKFKPDQGDSYEVVDDVYDIVWFKANPVVSDEMFQPPLGIYCTDDKITNNFPDLGEAYVVDIEYVFDHTADKGQSIFYQNVFFNQDTKLMRLDYDAPSPSEVAKFESSQITAVRDYKTGVEYKMDRSGTKCFISALGKAPTAESMFFENIKNYEYLGKYTIRDVLCDVWVGTGEDGITVEWAFLDESWKEEEDGELESRVPVQSLWFKWDDRNSSRGARNYFSFHRDPSLDHSSFDISPCFTNAQKKHFQVQFPVADPESVNLEELKRKGRSTIPNLIHVSSLRVDQVEAEYKESTSLVYLEFTLLARPNVPGDVLPSSPDDVHLDAAIQFLETVVKSNAFVLSVSLPGSIEQHLLIALPDHLLELEGPKGPCGGHPAASFPLPSLPEAFQGYRVLLDRSNSDVASPIPSTEQPSSMDKYNAGQLAGLAVGMFILGGTLGIIAMLLLLLHIDRSRGAQDGLRLCDKENAGAPSPQDFSPVTETSVD